MLVRYSYQNDEAKIVVTIESIFSFYINKKTFFIKVLRKNEEHWIDFGTFLDHSFYFFKSGENNSPYSKKLKGDTLDYFIKNHEEKAIPLSSLYDLRQMIGENEFESTKKTKNT